MGNAIIGSGDQWHCVRNKFWPLPINSRPNWRAPSICRYTECPHTKKPLKKLFKIRKYVDITLQFDFKVVSRSIRFTQQIQNFLVSALSKWSFESYTDGSNHVLSPFSVEYRSISVAKNQLRWYFSRLMAVNSTSNDRECEQMKNLRVLDTDFD